MNPENKDSSKEFGKVIDALHSKQKLPSLRTYQGDMAEFIKGKNESIISITVKEKEKIEEERKLEPPPKLDEKNFSTSFIVAVLSLFLVISGAIGLFYVFKNLKKEPVSEVVVEEKIIPYNSLITLANVTNKSLGPELAKISASNGITILKISDTNGLLFQKANDFLDFLEVSIPATLERTLKGEYAVGIISQNNINSRFIVLAVNDFGRAFSGMLDWEENMEEDLSFLNAETDSLAVTDKISNIPAVIATSTATSTITGATSTTTAVVVGTTTDVKIPMKLDPFIWKDIIVKNKDTRALVNSKNQTKIAYTFLDKNTILITNNLSTIGDIYSIYASRSVAR